MKISKQTIDALKSQGINVRWFPEETYEEFKKRVWQECYDYSYNYSKDNVRGSKATEEGRTNILYETMEEFEQHCRDFADRSWERHASPYEFTTLYVEHDGGQMLVKKENVKSKDITVEYVLKLVEKDRKVYAGTYGKFAMAMQKLCREKGLTNKFCVYPTTYGIGVWLFYNFNADKHIAQVEEIMKERNIEYYNEYSNARWVYRFKVSKKAENLSRLTA